MCVCVFYLYLPESTSVASFTLQVKMSPELPTEKRPPSAMSLPSLVHETVGLPGGHNHI